MKIVLENVDALPQPRPRFSGGRCYEPARIAKYKQDLGYLIKSAMKGKPPTKEAVKVQMKFFRKLPPTSRRYGDADNLAKAILDACNGIIFSDDSQIISLTAEKYQSSTPKIEMEVLPAD